MLQIVEVQNVAFFFRRLQGPAKIQCQSGIDRCRALIGGNILLQLRGLLTEVIFGKLLQLFFHSITACGKLLPDIRVQIF